MHHLAQAADEHQNAGVALGIGREAKDEVETHRLPAVGWHRQALQWSRGVTCRLHALTGLASTHVLGHPFVHVGPPECERYRVEGLLAAKMAAGGHVVHLMKYIELQILIVGYDNPRRIGRIYSIVEQTVKALVAVKLRALAGCQPRSRGILARSEVSQQRSHAGVLFVRIADAIVQVRRDPRDVGKLIVGSTR